MNDWIQESCKRQNQYTKARCVPHTNYEPFRKLLRNQVPFIVMWEGTKHLGTHQAPEARDLQADNRGTLPGLPCGLRDSLSCIIFVATKMNERSESNSGSLQGYTHCSVLDSIQTMSSSPHTLWWRSHPSPLALLSSYRSTFPCPKCPFCAPSPLSPSLSLSSLHLSSSHTRGVLEFCVTRTHNERTHGMRLPVLFHLTQ